MVMSLDQADIGTGNMLQQINAIAIVCIWRYWVLLQNDIVQGSLTLKGGISARRSMANTQSAISCLQKSIFKHGLSIEVHHFPQMLWVKLNTKSQSCTTYFAFNSYIGAIVLYCAEVLFMLRVWAMSSHQRWKWIVAFCSFVVLAAVPLGVILTFSNFSSIILQSPIPEITSCYISKMGHVVIVAFILLVITETGPHPMLGVLFVRPKGD
ncbi:hypothetical protein M405DRAFT_845110 [Rhizopogon salebrosus TDB-379]|nr:hypothetical protein M405DRAFT_845110 [Rhizopogon salebrosus TDB-379]